MTTKELFNVDFKAAEPRVVALECIKPTIFNGNILKVSPNPFAGISERILEGRPIGPHTCVICGYRIRDRSVRGIKNHVAGKHHQEHKHFVPSTIEEIAHGSAAS